MQSLAVNTEKRRQEYVDQVMGSMFAMAPEQKREVEESLISGALRDPLAQQHRFRERTTNANIYTRKYMPEKERTEVSALKEHRAMLKKTLFNEKEPTKKHHLRPKIQNLDQRSRLRFKAASPTTRV